MQVKKIVLDGKKNGFLVKLSNGSFIKTTKHNYHKVFGNLLYARALAATNGCITQKDYTLILKIGKNQIPMSITQRVNDHIEFYGKVNGEVILFKVYESSKRVATDCGYIVFDNGDKQRTHSKKRQNRLMDLMTDHIALISQKYGMIDEIIQYDEGITVIFRNTTTRLDIVSNKYLININQLRKEKQGVISEREYFRALPFDKDMDRYTTFYSFTSKEFYEPPRKNQQNIGVNTRLNMIDSIKLYWNGDEDHKPWFKRMKFAGDILF